MSAQKRMQSAGMHQGGIVAVRPTAEIITRQNLPSLGISAATAGAKGISMNLVLIPPVGGTAIYIISSRVETRYGPRLTDSIINQAGDFLYIPADLAHQPTTFICAILFLGCIKMHAHIGARGLSSSLRQNQK